MANNYIERQDIGDPLGLNSVPKKLQHSTSVVDRGYTQPLQPVGEAENIFKILYESTGQTLDAANHVTQQKIEEDKTLQTMRFYQGMAPTDDATVAGYRAHAVLGMQNSVLEQTARLKKEAETFTGTDEEWEKKVRDSQKTTVDTAFSSHPHLQKDPETLKAITTLYGEQVPQIAAARVAAKLTMEHEGRLTTLADNIRVRTNGLAPDEQYKVLDTVMSDAADAMQLSRKDREKVLMTMATERAKQGDLTYIDYTKRYKGSAQTSLYDRTAALQTAELEGKKVWTQQNQTALAQEKLDIFTKLEKGDIDKDGFFSAMGKLNQKYAFLASTDNEMISELRHAESVQKKEDKPWMHQGEYASDVAGLKSKLDAGKFKGDQPGFFKEAQKINEGHKAMVISDNEMRSMWEKHEGDVAGKVAIEDGIRQVLKGGQVGQDPYALNQGDPTVRKAVVEGTVKLYEDAAEQAIKQLPAGSTPAQQNAVRQQYRTALAIKLSQNQLENPKWTATIGILKDLDMETADKMTKLPQAAQNAIDLYNSLPAGSQLQHAKDPAVAAILENYNTFRQMGKSEPAALKAAQLAQRSQRHFTDAEFKAMDKAAEAVANDKANTWLPSALGGHTDAPTWMRDNMKRSAKEMMVAAIKAGATDVPTAQAMVKKVWDNNYTQLKNGQIVFGTRPTLASRMGVHADDIEATMETYKLMNKSQLEAQAGHSIKDMYFEVTPDRGTFAVRSGISGDYLTLPANLNTMKAGRDGYISNNQDSLIKKAGEKAIDLFHAAQDYFHLRQGPDGSTKLGFAQPENLPEHNETMWRTIGQVENPDRVGYRPNVGSYVPYDDNGGHAIGYGHRLTPKDIKNGYIELDGVRYSIGGSRASQITEDVARRLVKRDLAKFDSDLKRDWKGYDNLPLKYKGVLTNIAYNTGSALPQNWPKLKEAMDRGDDARVRKEMITSFRDKDTGNKIPLTDRARIVADRFGLKR